MVTLIAQDTLDKSRFFLARAREVPVGDREVFKHFFEAAVVFARSVTFHLQKQLAAKPGFDGWYGKRQQELASNRLCRFFLEQRNYILKAGPAPVVVDILVQLTDGVTISAHFQARVIRGKPWYRRRPQIIVNDLMRWVKSLYQRWRVLLPRRRTAAGVTPARVSETWRFAQEEWRDRPALDLLADYLEVLSAVVREAAVVFGDGTHDCGPPSEGDQELH